MVVGDGVEVHSGVSVRGENARRADGDVADVRGVEQDLRTVIDGFRRT
jgi:hypothetical protein